MGNLVIVAIPDENDRVWKISSEKVPHLTVLFLGEVDNVVNLDQIMLFVDHAAATTLRRFYLPVDRRGELGADKADVLFFKKNRYDFKAVRDFRSLLLKDPNIKTAYDSTRQFETPEEVGASGQPWIPHLTLGYPETPAKKLDEQDFGFYSVDFNKLAVWTGDFEGPDFLLKDYGEEFDEMAIPMDVAMSDLQHYGVRGMRWGVRNTPQGEGGRREGIQRYLDPQGHNLSTDAAKAAAGVIVPPIAPLTIPAQIRLTRGGIRGAKAKLTDREEKKFAKKAQSAENFVKIHNGSGDRFNREIGGINKKYPEDLTKNPAKQKQYDNEVQKLMQDSYRQSANSIGNKRQTMHLDVKFKNDGYDFTIHAKEGAPTPLPKRVKHAAEDEDETVTFSGKIKRDATGHIVGFEFEDFDQDAMAQTVNLGIEFLEHFGVKGMRWGVRNEDVPGSVKSVGKAAKTAGTAVGKPVKTTTRFAKDVNFETRVDSGKARRLVVKNARKPFRKEDLPVVKARHGDYAKMRNRAKKPLSKEARAYRKDAKETYIKRLETTANSMTNASGDRQYTIRERGWELPAEGGALPTSKRYWDVSSRNVRHADEDNFTRLEVIEDNEGYITDLKEVEIENAMAQTADLGSEFLEHFGVKGMKWGVRNEDIARGAKSAAKSVGKAAAATVRFAGDVDFENQVETGRAREMVITKANPAFRRTDLPAVKARHGDYGKLRNRAKKPFAPEARAYRKDAKETYIKRLETSANSIKNFSGDRQYTIRERGWELPEAGGALPSSRHYWDVSSRKVQHAVADSFTRLEVIEDDEGYITDLKKVPIENSMAQTVELGAEFIEHFGVKGMRWGVRNERSVATDIQRDTGIVRRKTKVRAKGGESQPAHDDAVKAAVQKQKLKKSGTDALSNTELKQLANRLELEVRVETLATKKGRKFISRQLETQGQQQLQKGLGRGISTTAGRVAKKGGKAAGTAALLA